MQRSLPIAIYFPKICPVVKETGHFFNIVVCSCLDQRHLERRWLKQRNLVERTERAEKGERERDREEGLGNMEEPAETGERERERGREDKTACDKMREGARTKTETNKTQDN